MLDSLEYFFIKYGVEKNKILKIITGQRYIAVLLDNGNIGVCATLGENISFSDEWLNSADIADLHTRIFLNAYYNALLNYSLKNYDSGDLFDVIELKSYKNIVMIGYFKPIVEKMNTADIDVSIFDLRDLDVSLPLNYQKKYLANCDAAIVSATSVFNNTFDDIAKNCAGDIFILGPSSLMNDYFFTFPNVKAIFGSIFKPFDNRVLDMISRGEGTRKFLKLGQKIVYSKKNYENN